MKLKQILIAVGFVIATIIAFALGLLNLEWAVTGILVELALAWILSKILKEKQVEAKELAKAISEESEKQKEKEKLVNHSKLLVDENLRFRSKTYVGFRIRHELNLCVQGEPSSVDAPEYRKYFKETDGHLESGYWDEIWKYKEDRDSLIKEHNNTAQLFLEKTIKEIIKEVNSEIPSLTKWDGSGQPPLTKYIIPQYVGIDVGYVLQYSMNDHLILINTAMSNKKATNGEYLSMESLQRVTMKMRYRNSNE